MSYWFRPKRYGYGATPSNWKGWLATVLFVALMATVPALAPMRSGAEGDYASWIAFAILAILFIGIAWKKTDGAWRWRWGSDGNGKLES
jgi:hypothetical protein